jgi:hypothetical protein
MTEENDFSRQMSLIKPEIESSGDAKVNAAMERLRDTSELPVSEHLEVFDDVHRRLQDVLSETHD